MFNSEPWSTLEIIGKAVEDTNDLLDKTPLERAVDIACDEMVEEKWRSMGLEEGEIEWLKGTAIKDWRIVRLGT